MTELGEGADLAVSEAYRTLRPGGIYFVAVKEGKGFIRDEKEGLVRYIQLYEEADLRELLERNGLSVVRFEHCEEKRGADTIRSLWAYAQKPVAQPPAPQTAGPCEEGGIGKGSA